MTDDDVQALIAEFSLSTRKIEGQQQRLLKKFDTTFGAMEKSGSKRLTAIEKRSEQMSRNVRRAILAIGVGVAGREVLEYEASWRATTNTLKQYTDVLGPAQQSASALNAIASDARAPLSELSGLTGAAARSARDLGKSGADVLIFGEAAAKGARLANTGGAAVEGAFIQLSQAIASPRVQLQEFNSIIEGTPRLAQAFAEGVKGAGGSVAKLRKMIADGDVSGGDLFTALIGQADKIRAEFATLDQGPAEALTRLQNKLTEFIGTNTKVKGATAGLVEIIDLAADNLDILTDSIIVGSAALAGFFGAQGLLAVGTGLNSVAVGATQAAKAMAILRAGMAFFGGPIPIAIAAVAAGIALIMLNSDKAGAPLQRMRTRLDDIETGLQDVAKAAGIPWEDITKGANATKEPVDEATARVEELRKKLVETGVAARQIAIDQATTKIIESMAAREEALQNIETIQNKREFRRAGNAKQKAEQLATATDQLAEAERRLGEAEELRSQLFSRTTAADFKPEGESAGGGKGPTDAETKAAKAALKELELAILSTYDAERQVADDTYRERIAAIKTLGLTGQEAVNRQLAAEIELQDERARIAKEEKDAAADKLKREKELSDKEIDLVQQTLDARDRAAGRSIAIALREFEARRKVLETSFADTPEGNARKAEALDALDQEEATFKVKARDATTGFETENPVQARIKQIEEAAQRELDLEAEKKATLLDYEKEYEARRLEIIQASEDQIAEVRKAALAAQLGAAADVFSGMSGLAKTFAGEQSGIYKAMFATEQALRAGQALLAAPAAAAKAMAEVPYPLNFAAAAMVYASAMSQVAKIGSVSPGFKDGVVDLMGPGTGRSDSINIRASKGESIITEPGTRKNRNVLKMINAGADVEAMLSRVSAPVSASPAFLTSGGRQINISGSQYVFNGPVDRESLPSIRAMLDQRERSLVGTIEDVMARDRVQTTPRHKRDKFMRGKS